MSSTPGRHVRAFVSTAFLLVWGAAPALAADRTELWPAVKPEVTVTLAAVDVFVPSAASTKIVLDGQAPRTVFTVPRTGERTGLSSPVLRRSLIVSFGALQALDAHSTMKALKGGARESNPAMGAIASNRTALLAVKAGTAAATAYFAERLSRKNPKRAIVLMAVLNSAYVAIVAHNYRVAGRSR